MDTNENLANVTCVARNISLVSMKMSSLSAYNWLTAAQVCAVSGYHHGVNGRNMYLYLWMYNAVDIRISRLLSIQDEKKTKIMKEMKSNFKKNEQIQQDFPG